MQLSDLPILVLEFVLLLPALVLHEVSHGWVAYKLGDPTAKMAGRLTLDPTKHIDLWGTIVLPLLLLFASGGQYAFGYAKPVPINPHLMRRTSYQTGLLLTGIAGPITNILLALAGTVLFRILMLFSATLPDIVLSMAYFFVYINLALCFFNLIPIPPFDGSRVLQWFLKGRALHWYYEVEKYGFFVIAFLVFVLPSLTGVDPLRAYLSVTVAPLARLLLGA